MNLDFFSDFSARKFHYPKGPVGPNLPQPCSSFGRLEICWKWMMGRSQVPWIVLPWMIWIAKNYGNWPYLGAVNQENHAMTWECSTPEVLPKSGTPADATPLQTLEGPAAVKWFICQCKQTQIYTQIPKISHLFNASFVVQHRFAGPIPFDRLCLAFSCSTSH